MKLIELFNDELSLSDTAKTIYWELLKYLEKQKNLSKFTRNSKQVVIPSYFLSDENFHNLSFIFDDNVTLFVYDYTRDNIFVPYKPSTIEDMVKYVRDNKLSFYHEIIHYLDKKYNGEEFFNFIDNENPSVYFNTKHEFNAYWQEGFNDIVNMIDDKKIDAYSFQSFDDFKEYASTIWDIEFLNNLNNYSQKIFLKRLLELYKEIKNIN